MFDTPTDKTNQKSDTLEAKPNKLSEENSGFFHEAYAGFKARAVQSVSKDHQAESLGRGVLSMGLAAAIDVASRGKDFKTSLALGAAGAAGVQAIWSLVKDDSDKSVASLPFFSRVGSKLGAATYDALALGVVPGLVGSGASRGTLNYFDAALGERTIAATAVARDAKITEAAKLEDLLPVNAWSRSPEPIGRQLSNFAETPFVLHGKPYASIEGFYNSLLYLDKDRRAEIAGLSGLEAKLAGNSSNLAVTRYGKQMITLGSEEHHNLVEEALRAKFDQNPELKQAFIETHPRPIIHDTGAPDKPGAHFPREVFEGIMNKIRSEYVAAQQKLGL